MFVARDELRHIEELEKEQKPQEFRSFSSITSSTQSNDKQLENSLFGAVVNTGTCCIKDENSKLQGTP
jgi:hypothetical protein